MKKDVIFCCDATTMQHERKQELRGFYETYVYVIYPLVIMIIMIFLTFKAQAHQMSAEKVGPSRIYDHNSQLVYNRLSHSRTLARTIDLSPLELPNLSSRMLRRCLQLRLSLATRACLPTSFYSAPACRRLVFVVTHRSFSASSFCLKRPAQRSKKPSVEPNLPKTTIEEFKELAESDQATLEHAHGCLVLHKADVQALPNAEQKRRAKELDAGRQVLAWIWKSDVDGWNSAVKGRDFPAALCWFILAQDLEEFLWEWMTEQAKQPETRQSEWLQKLLAGLARAHIEWEDGGVNSALAAHSRAHDLFPGAATTAKGKPLMAMEVAIERAWHGPRCPVADETLFDSYAETHTKAMDTKYRAQNRAELQLFHPTRPDPSLYLDMLRYDEGYLCNLRSLPIAALRNAAACLLRSAYIFRHQDRVPDAQYCEEHAAKLDSRCSLWAAKKKRALDEDPRLHSIRQAGMRIPWADASTPPGHSIGESA